MTTMKCPEPVDACKGAHCKYLGPHEKGRDCDPNNRPKGSCVIPCEACQDLNKKTSV